MSLPIFLTDIKTLDGHTIVSDYELKPISLPGANGVVVLDHLAYDRLIPTATEARGVIAAKGKTAYLIDPAEGRILKLTPR